MDIQEKNVSTATQAASPQNETKKKTGIRLLLISDRSEHVGGSHHGRL